MSIEQVVEVLRQTELFAELGEPVLLDLAGRLPVRGYARGQTVFAQEELGDRLFVVAAGAVRLVVRSRHGEELEVIRRVPPAIFGELAVLDGGPRSTSAEAVEPTTLIVVARVELIRLLHADARVSDGLLRWLGGLVRRSTEHLTDQVFLSLEERVAGKLLELAGGPAGRSRRLRASGVTQTQLATMVGGARQSVNVALQRLERRGFIRLGGRTIEILQPDELRRRAGR
ncbi:MAG TPA: Crp/Fnr family transcriptional regulator [Actinomycetes bacterium]|nr:Crp/Fnr family transcriptional regulator [Actinomycetes bacterium]